MKASRTAKWQQNNLKNSNQNILKMETPVTKAQGQEFAKIVEEINQLGRSLGPAAVDLQKMHKEQWDSYSWGPEDYETRLYQSHMRQKALEDAVMNALLLCAQHPQEK